MFPELGRTHFSDTIYIGQHAANTMPTVKRVILDILKPHSPNVLEFARSLASSGQYHVKVTVVEMDEQTETLEVVIEGEDIDFDAINGSISEIGGSLHSIDEVEVSGIEPQ